MRRIQMSKKSKTTNSKSLLEKMKDLSQQYKSQYQDRMAICEGCDKLDKHSYQCRKCGCFMKIKAKMPGKSCPLGKW
jgi:hypothetical protein